MISAVLKYGNLLVIRNSNGDQIGNYTLNGGTLVGHSSSFLVVRYQNQILTINERGQTIGMTPIVSGSTVQGITDSGFNIALGSVMEVYDIRCCRVNHYSI